MSKLSQKQIQAILQLPAPQKYSHFIKESADSDEIWTLYKGLIFEGDVKDNPKVGGEYAFLEDDSSNLFLPLWPAEEYASLCRVNGWESFEPLCMGVGQFLEEYLPMFAENNVKFCIFPTPEDSGVIPSVEELVRDLNLEMSQYE